MKPFFLLLAAAGLVSAQHFQQDVELLGEGGIVLERGGAKVLISPKYQGKVLVSTMDQKSIGWIDRKALAAGIGAGNGADRLWLGPDGSQYSVFFEPGVELEEENWRVPPEIATGGMKVTALSRTDVVLEKDVKLNNHLGTQFHIHVKRKVELLDGREPFDGLTSVGFRVTNTMTNLGEHWKAENGLISLWSLATFPGGDLVDVHVPVAEKKQVRQYFKPFQKNQLRWEKREGWKGGGVASFRCNGNWRSKIGLAPEHSVGVLVALDPARRLLTVIRYKTSKGGRFPHAERGEQERPYDGDLVNVYNHGSLDRSALPERAFFEMESASEMPELMKGGSHSHWQEVWHYRGDFPRLQEVAERILSQK